MEQKSLAETLHEVLPEPSEEETIDRFITFSGNSNKRTENTEKKRPQLEIIDGNTTETYRYNAIFEKDKFDYHEDIVTPNENRWPGLNLYVEKGLAKIADKIGNLEGKTVVSIRPEYYPFFGIQTAKMGAKTILIDGRTITTVEDLINGTRQYSHELSRNAKRKWNEGFNREEAIASQDKSLREYSRYELLSTIVQQRENILPEVWNKLNDIEKTHYIFECINENPMFIRDASEYYGKNTSTMNSNESDKFYDIPDSERFPYIFRFLEENFDQSIEKEKWHISRGLVNNRLRNTLSPDEEFSVAIEDIYAELVEKIYIRSSDGKLPTDTEIQSAIVETLFQSKNEEEHKRIRHNLEYRYGKELGETDIQDSSVDVMFSGWGLDYLENSIDFVANAAKMLKEKGLFIGYVKEKNNSSSNRKRDLGDPEKLSEALQVSGFEDIVIVKKKDFDGWTSEEEIGLIYFARKAADTRQTGIAGFLPDTKFFNSGLFPQEQEEKPTTPNIGKNQTTRTWEQDITLDQLTDALSPEDISCIATSLYGNNIDNPTDNDRKNILRGLQCRYSNYDEITRNMNSLSTHFKDTLRQYTLKQRQVESLLEDLNEALRQINSFEDTTHIEEAIAEKSAIIGNEKIPDYLRRIKEILSITELHPSLQARLDKEQKKLIKAYNEEINPHGDQYTKAFESNEVYFTSLERRRQLNEVARDLMEYFMDYDYSFNIDLDSRSTIRTSIGRIHKIAKYEYFDREHEVLFVDQNISKIDETAQALYTNAVEEISEKKYVFLDIINRRTKELIQNLKKGTIPELIKRQWGNLKEPEQILRDIAYHSSIHEIQHAYDTGEIGSYLAELAYGKTPYYDLYNKTTMLFELADDKHMGDLTASILRSMGIIRDSEHLKAAAELLPYYLDASIESGRLDSVLEEIVCSTYCKNASGHLSLDKKKALLEYKAIMKALTYLNESEIRDISIGLMESKLGTTFDHEPEELTSATPLIINKAQIDQIDDELKQDYLAFLKDKYDLPLPIASEIDKALSTENRLKQSHRIGDLASIIGETNTYQAIELAESISQRYPREKALMKLAYQIAEKGDISKATEVLRNIENSIYESRMEFGEEFTFFRELGDSFLMYPELVELKNRLGLQDESHELLSAIERQLLNQEPSEMKMNEYRTLLDIARRKDTIGYKGEAIALVSKVEDMISQNDSEYLRKKTATIETILAKAEITKDRSLGRQIAGLIADKDWIDDYENYLNSLDVLAKLSCRNEIESEADRMIQAIEQRKKPRIVDSQIYNSLAQALYNIGDKERARELWFKSHQYNLKISEKQRDSVGGWYYGFEMQANTMSQYPELLDEATEIALNIKYFPKRGEVLKNIGEKYISSGEPEKGLATMAQAERYMNDEYQKSKIKMRLQSECERLGYEQKKLQ